ncbi:MAG: hypothetical protein K8R88_03535 [Armatimonadetes bacterium]|nr:hypothetical protein [Armatimonadota bacterium]
MKFSIGLLTIGILAGCGSQSGNLAPIGKWAFNHVRGTVTLTIRPDKTFKIVNSTCVSDTELLYVWTGTYSTLSDKTLKLNTTAYNFEIPSYNPKSRAELKETVAKEQAASLKKANAEPALQFYRSGNELIIDNFQGQKVAFKSLPN